MKRRALVSAPWIPEFDRNRGAQRVDAMIRFLCDAGWSVTFLAQQKVGDDWHAQRLRELGVATFAGYEHAQDVVSTGRFELAVIAFWQPGEQLIPTIRSESPSTRIMLDTHDLWFLREARRRLGVEGSVGDGYGESMARELNTYQLADALLTVSVREAEWLNDLLGPGRAEFLPMEEPRAHSSVPFDARRGSLFVGNFRHLPNGDAVEYLCRDVVPLLEPDLLSEHPLSVVGNHLDEKIRAYSKNLRNVHMIGWVPSVQPYLERARVSVVPLLYGAGVKGKVLQALMLGTPVVTTPIGAEGLDLVDEEHVLIESTAGGLAKAVTRLLTEPETWSRISEAGRAHVAGIHDEEEVRRRFIAVVDEVLARPVAESVVPDAFRHSRRRYESYRETVRAVWETVRCHTEPGTVVLVVSKGDDELVALDGRTARHFPQTGDGRWAGYHPEDSEQAVACLEEQRGCGGRYLLLPDSAFWWLHHYRELADHLESRYLRLHSDDHVVLYDLGRQPSDDTSVVDARPGERPRVVVVGTDTESGTAPPAGEVAALDGSLRFDVSHRWLPAGAAHPRAVDGNAALDERADWVVYVDDSAELRPGFIDDFLGLADRLGADRAQAPHTAGPGAGRPVTERLRGCVAREVAAPTTLPVMAVRSGASADGPVLLTDAVPIALRRSPTETLEGTDTAADAPVNGVFVQGPDRVVRGPQRTGSSPAPLISVLIATYDRPDLLAVCLEGFCSQTLPQHSFEVVVVDDGSPGGETARVLDDFAARLPMCRTRIEHAGRGAAKNLAVLLARSDLVLFFDDDDRPSAELLEEHVRAHRRHPAEGVAILGHTSWAPEIEVTPFMHFLTDVDKVLFSYGNLTEGAVLDWRGFWEGRLSCKRSLLLRHGLHDQRLEYSIDVELGWRLARHGLEVRYWPSARSFMTRPVGVGEFCARTERKARAQATMVSLHPCEEMRGYARIKDARKRWESARPQLDELLARARDLEDVLRRRWPGRNLPHDAPGLTDLHASYRAILDAHSAKGLSDVLAPMGDIPAPDVAAHHARIDHGGDGHDPELPELTVTIPVWSRTPELADMAARTIERVRAAARLRTEVLVIDNGSPHRRRFAARVRRFDENRGVSAGWNEGIRLARAPVVAVLNSDCLVEPGWDEALVEAATSGRRIAFPYTDHGDGRGFRQPDQGGTAGWCFALTKVLYSEVGPFDERFSPAFCEDTDYWHRAWELGIELSPVPAGRVTHVRRATTGIDPHTDWLLQGHRYKYGWKHGVDPHRAPPYYNRQIVEYHCRGLTGAASR